MTVPVKLSGVLFYCKQNKWISSGLHYAFHGRTVDDGKSLKKSKNCTCKLSSLQETEM